jgi:hypothetical protein
MTTAARRVRIYRARTGVWIIIDRDYATYSASTWRKAMDLACPPSRARVEIHAEMPVLRAFNAVGEQTFPTSG